MNQLLPLEMFDLRMALNGDMYRPFVFGDPSKACNEWLAIEIALMRFGSDNLNADRRSLYRRLRRMRKRELLKELNAARLELSEAYDTDEFRAMWYAKITPPCLARKSMALEAAMS